MKTDRLPRSPRNLQDATCEGMDVAICKEGLAVQANASEAVSGHLHSQISGALGEETASQIQEIMNKAMRGSDSIWATIIGIITILVGAAGVFVPLQKSLNR
jgi:membrane protein